MAVSEIQLKEALDSLKDTGVRITPQRHAILEYLINSMSHPTADDIYKAMQKRKQMIYTPFFWRYIMFIIQHIPSFIFRRLSF